MRLPANPLLLASPAVQFPEGSSSSILMFSMRRVADLVGATPQYEFESLMAQLLGADVAHVSTIDGLNFGRKVYKVVRQLTRSERVAETLRPKLGAVPLQKSYDVFLPFINHPHELYALNGIEDWRGRFRFSACCLNEAYTSDLPAYLIEQLRGFDHIFISCSGSVERIAEMTGVPCSYLPLGVDTLRFSPGKQPPERLIDVTSIGRRSPVTHKALLAYAEQNDAYYHYDTVKTGGHSPIMFSVTNVDEHRRLLANTLKRSRYFIANRAWADRPMVTGDHDEMPSRFYEGAAAGCIMLGEPTDSDDFRSQFFWDDAVIPAPFHDPNIAKLIAELDAQPERLARARTNNVVNSLLKHDWVYRLRDILDVAKLAPTPAMQTREHALQQAAADMRAAGDAAA